MRRSSRVGTARAAGPKRTGPLRVRVQPQSPAAPCHWGRSWQAAEAVLGELDVDPESDDAIGPVSAGRRLTRRQQIDRILLVCDVGKFTDPDGFTWKASMD